MVFQTSHFYEGERPHRRKIRHAAMLILIVEDNAELVVLLKKLLATAGFTADAAESAEDAALLFAPGRYAAILLDVRLPGADGFSFVRTMRERGDSTPVLMLTARGGVRDRVAGLTAGADDYLEKPFAPEELIARIQALLRRPGAMAPRKLQMGRLTLNRETREIAVEGVPHVLSGRELQLLEFLLGREGRVVSKQQLEESLFGLTSEFGSNAVEVYVHRLRRRLEQIGAGIQVITVRGVGYMLACTS